MAVLLATPASAAMSAVTTTRARSALAGREPTVYRRYAHWWITLPCAEARVLAG
jgi:hypothetical protein